MESLLLQDFTTQRGTSTTSIIQPAYGWLDLGDLEDVVIYTDIRETTPASPIAVNMTFETAPAPVDSAFVTVVPSFAVAVGLRTDNLTAYLANVPLARYLRWHLTGSQTPWDLTFRCWVAAYGWT